MIALNKTIAYTKSWKHTIWIAVLLSLIVPLLLILLEPFDSSNDFSNKNLLLSGYAFCILVPIIILHPVENTFYQRQKNRWFVFSECIYILLTLLVILIGTFFYHFYFISGLANFNINMICGFVKSFGLPFTPIIVPLWVYLRSKYGIIEVPGLHDVALKDDKKIIIKGENKTETLALLESDFIYAHSQQNYVDIYYNTDDGVEELMFRFTLSNIMKQLPNAWQVHRSYLVNLDYLTTVEGNSRKRFMKISKIEEPIPISQKYYLALKTRLANSSQTLQN
ncbi:LytR/AlgR family response regulator transcription factor [Winogradskyella forsetii]|uniref:LytR/AlgR family response regulator transcription factor n=1 Tax=Winogradskyella forsetii TaxID=2686077 RepID=UPI0015C1893A|nr:LytTR family DNA-binding domain-containing protein [Winogradskyella forsetii]